MDSVMRPPSKKRRGGRKSKKSRKAPNLPESTANRNIPPLSINNDVSIIELDDSIEQSETLQMNIISVDEKKHNALYNSRFTSPTRSDINTLSAKLSSVEVKDQDKNKSTGIDEICVFQTFKDDSTYKLQCKSIEPDVKNADDMSSKFLQNLPHCSLGPCSSSFLNTNVDFISLEVSEPKINVTNKVKEGQESSLFKTTQANEDVIVIDDSLDQSSVIIIDDDDVVPPKKAKIKHQGLKVKLKKKKSKLPFDNTNPKIIKNIKSNLTKSLLDFKSGNSNYFFTNQQVNLPKNNYTIKNQQVNNNINTLREIVIDGSNVAFGRTSGKKFSVEGLEIAIKYFLDRGHKVTAFVPQFRCKRGQSTNPQLLETLKSKGLVVFTPSRQVLGKCIVPYDDKLILEYASMKNAIVVSNDNYQDLFQEHPEWQDTIKYRLLMYTWVDDVLLFPQDPLGRNGPTLTTFLQLT